MNFNSPITVDLITQESISFCDMQSDGEALFWSEMRPREKGRVALMKRTAEGEISEILPGEISVRNRVHELGGAAFCVRNSILYFSNDLEGSFCRLDPEEHLKKLCTDPHKRFADGSMTPNGERLYLVCEEHRSESVVNFLAMMDQTGKLTVVAEGHDFYSSPRLSPDAKQLAFLTWDYPNMPWDGTTLWLANLEETGKLTSIQRVAGGEEESICQVYFSPSGTLYFCSDQSGFWNLYRLNKKRIEPVYSMDAEFGLPAWLFGKPTYTFIRQEDKELIVAVYSDKGIDRLSLIDPDKSHLDTLDLPFTMVTNLCTCKNQIYFFGASPTLPLSLISLNPFTGTYEVIKKTVMSIPSQKWISKPKLVEYPSDQGKVGYGFLYPATPPIDKPPLIVRCHGGPNARTYAYLNLEIQYWTSRGFSVLDINYGGSTGYGREYRKRLEGKWGVVDVDDAISAAKTIVEKELVDADAVFIRGGSAGGFTTLLALAKTTLFAGGTSCYGISDLELLAHDTHKFEARYIDKLIGPYPKEKALICARSPIHHINHISSPVLLLQGDEDKIVPANQSETIYLALKSRAVPATYILLRGEGHGFRRAENIKIALEAELDFYLKILARSN